MRDDAAMGFERLARQRRERHPALAPTLLALLRDPPGWVRRRVETIDLDSLEEARSHVTLDLWLPGETQRRLAVDGGRRIIVPLGLGVKGEKLSQLDLRAEDEPASLMSFDENRLLSAHVLEAVLAGYGAAVGDDDLLAITGLAGTATVDASRRIASSVGEGNARHDVERWLRVLGGKYILYGALPARSPFVEQRHVRLAQTKPRTRRADARNPGSVDSRAGDGWSIEARVELTNVGFAARYHLDLGVPPHVRIVQAQLAAHESSGLVPLGGASERDCDRATLETPLARSRELDPLEAEVVADLVLVPERRAFSREALPVSVAMFATTLLAMVPLIANTRAPGGLTALLVAPVVAAAALIFRPSGPLERRTVAPRQALLGLHVAFTFLAACLVVVADVLSWQDISSITAAAGVGSAGPSVRRAVETLLFGATILLSAGGVIVQARGYRRAAVDR